MSRGLRLATKSAVSRAKSKHDRRKKKFAPTGRDNQLRDFSESLNDERSVWCLLIWTKFCSRNQAVEILRKNLDAEASCLFIMLIRLVRILLLRWFDVGNKQTKKTHARTRQGCQKCFNAVIDSKKLNSMTFQLPLRQDAMLLHEG